MVNKTIWVRPEQWKVIKQAAEKDRRSTNSLILKGSLQLAEEINGTA